MKNENIHTEKNRSISSFIKMNKTEQIALIQEQGICLDFDRVRETITRVYFLQGFFVEETFCSKLNEVTDIMPYKNGYKIGQFLKTNTSSINERPFYFQYCIN